ncbi:hypothetical protein AYI68_g4812, partial [Smittium mucronatum]
MNHETAPS